MESGAAQLLSFCFFHAFWGLCSLEAELGPRNDALPFLFVFLCSIFLFPSQVCSLLKFLFFQPSSDRTLIDFSCSKCLALLAPSRPLPSPVDIPGLLEVGGFSLCFFSLFLFPGCTEPVLSGTEPDSLFFGFSALMQQHSQQGFECEKQLGRHGSCRRQSSKEK